MSLLNTVSSLGLLAQGEKLCDVQQDIQQLLAPYLFALMIEFCVVASTMVIAIWEKAGQVEEEPE